MQNRNQFSKNEKGAVSVEWVVLTAALLGLGIALLTDVGPRIASFMRYISAFINGYAVGEEAMLESYDFSDGSGTWSGASVSEITGFGDVLGPISGSGGLELVSNTFTVPEGTSVAELSLNVLAIDSIDGEDAVLYIDGVEVGRVTSNQTDVWFTNTSNVDGLSISHTVLANNDVDIGGPFNGTAGWENDGIVRMTFTLNNPPTSFSFGMGTELDSAANDESYAIDNVSLIAY